MFTDLLLTLVISFAQQPPRDAIGAAPPSVSGTATISGVVITDDADRRPVRRARVSIMDVERRGGATVITNDNGRFLFRNVPAGRYAVTPAKNAWVGVAYGATRPGRPGTPIIVRDGQTIDDLTLRLAPGAVITGTVTDETGRPMAAATVRTFRYVYQGGTRNLVPAGMSVTPSDDRGVYRIFGLAPGQYVVAASAPGNTMGAQGTEIRQTTDAAIQRALSGRGGVTPSGPPGEEEREVTVAYAAIFYPGTPVASQASTIMVGAGEERGGIDFQLSLVPTCRVEGTIVHADGTPAAHVAVNLISSDSGAPGFGLETFRNSRTTAEGRFTMTGLQPGRYTIVSRASAPGESAPPAPAARPFETPTPSLWAMTDLALDGQNVTGITLTLQPGFTVSGKVDFKGSLPLPDLSRIRVQLMPATAPGQVNVGVQPAAIRDDGTFTITGVAPGTYRVMSMLPNPRPDQPAWTLASATFGGREVLDAPADLREAVKDAVLTFTDSAPELSGTLQDPSGRPAPEYYIIVFAKDSAFWTPQSRRIRMVRPSVEGRFTIRNLPAGDYLIAAVTDIEDGEWTDPTVLQQLAGGSMPLTIGEGEKKVQNIQVGQ